MVEVASKSLGFFQLFADLGGREVPESETLKIERVLAESPLKGRTLWLSLNLLMVVGI